MIERPALLNDLKQQVALAQADLARQVKAIDEVSDRLRGEYDRARKLGRTAATWNTWLNGDGKKLEGRTTQVAVAWVLSTVFVRFCEDNRLIAEPYLTGPDDDRRELAQARYEAYVESDMDPTYRGWLERAFADLGAGQAGRLLFDRRHNPLCQIPLSHDGARALVEFWRRRDGRGALVHDFTDPLNENRKVGWDTRFLGDLYQELSEAARANYALLQTPEFVAKFILDRTMSKAIGEFGHEKLQMIDPTCGSGHFVLGAFRRLVRLWEERQSGTDLYEQVRAALDSVHGVDINPFAVAIARFRLLIAAMAASDIRTLAEAGNYEWPIHLAVGDSLIRARQPSASDELAEFTYATEDVHKYNGILELGRYHVVVGNPPYITVKDKNLNKAYRERYDDVCAGKYALSVPFAKLFFELAKRGDDDGHGYGMVGQITANSFMKREFGTRLIENYFSHKVELTEVIDASGAYIPGHGTPTVILIGRRREEGRRSPKIRVIRSVQGEPSAPVDAEDGLVWNAIVEQIDKPGSVSKWVSADDLDRSRYFGRQPWVLADGGLEMLESIAAASVSNLSAWTDSIGITSFTLEDDLYLLSSTSADRIKLPHDHLRPMVTGDLLRDWVGVGFDDAVFPYDSSFDPIEIEHVRPLARYMWPGRTIVSHSIMFDGRTKVQSGLRWAEYGRLTSRKLRTPLSITFAFVATHNHFVLDRGGKIFNRSAPVIKLPEGASEEEHLRLLGLLNSSTACFWLKMVSQSKGNGGIGGGISDELWEHRFEFTGTKLAEFSVPDRYPIRLASAIEDLAQQFAVANPAALVAKGAPTGVILREARDRWEFIRAWMIALQEEMDWQVYAIYGLCTDDLRVSDDPYDANIPALALGERAFEIVLARKVAAGEASDEWFKRHGSAPITEIPDHWPASYRDIVQKRIDAIESSRAIGMVERPEYKRRWATEGWDALQEKALRSWLLDRIERREHWYDVDGHPAIVSLARLTDALSRDEDFVSVARLYAPRADLPKIVAELMTDEHVPFLAALRYKPTGLDKRADWERVWDLQRQEDAASDEQVARKIRDSIPVPPKYAQADFLRTSYWKARGKLDVPKERFISYGRTNAATPDLYGWAGWDNRERAQALAIYFTNHALSSEEIVPFLAGLLELQPWLYQWHDAFDPAYSGSPARYFDAYRQATQGEHGLTNDDLRAWRPAAAARGRRATGKSST